MQFKFLVKEGEHFGVLAFGASVESMVVIATTKATMEFRVVFADVTCCGADDRHWWLLLAMFTVENSFS